MNGIVIIGSINPFGSRVGGTRNYVMNFLSSVDPDVNIVFYGFTTRDNVDKAIGENIVFSPLVIYEKEKETYHVPQTFKFILKLFERKNEILSKGKVLHIQRLDHTIPFLFPVKQGKIVVYFHGSASKGYLTGKGFKSKFKGFLYLILEHLILSKMDKIVTVSRRDGQYYHNTYPKVRDKIVTISIPLNLGEFRIIEDKKGLRRKYGLSEDHKIVLYAGRFSKVKGIDFIIDVFNTLNRDLPDTDLILVGQGEEEKRLRRLASNAQANTIKFLGSLSHEEMPYILNCADVLVMASQTEGMPTVILEALACGVPVISTKVGDVEHIIVNDRIGFIAAHNNMDDYNKKLIKALEISDKYKEDRVKVAAYFSSSSISRKIVKMHEDLAK